MASFVLEMSPFIVSCRIHSISVLHLPPRNIANQLFSPVFPRSCAVLRPCEKRTLRGNPGEMLADLLVSFHRKI